jgi:3-phosphoshikimate 1-carboxyvinyltransferase
MTKKIIQQCVQGIKGEITVPGDKSISHRSVMFGSIAYGKTTVHGFLRADDCLSTISCFQALGVNIQVNEETVVIEGKGFAGLKQPLQTLDVGNSGTTIRLLLGILSTLPFTTTITGDASIAKRPMDRVVNPLRLMGAEVIGERAPITINGKRLTGITYRSPVASAQIKSALIFAGLNSEGVTKVIEPSQSRDHTERMLPLFKGSVDQQRNESEVKGLQELQGTTIHVPGDISSAAFFVAAATIVPNSHLIIKNVGLNSTRTGFLDVLKAMGANISIINTTTESGEPKGDIEVKYSANLSGIEVSGTVIPRMIDEIPLLALIATQAQGTTIIKDASELKVKETNRIAVVVNELIKCGAAIESTADGMIITGQTPLHHSDVSSNGDHRIGMMLAIAGCLASGGMTIHDSEAVSISYPAFFEHLEKVVSQNTNS